MQQGVSLLLRLVMACECMRTVIHGNCCPSENCRSRDVCQKAMLHGSTFTGGCILSAVLGNQGHRRTTSQHVCLYVNLTLESADPVGYCLQVLHSTSSMVWLRVCALIRQKQCYSQVMVVRTVSGHAAQEDLMPSNVSGSMSSLPYYVSYQC